MKSKILIPIVTFIIVVAMVVGGVMVFANYFYPKIIFTQAIGSIFNFIDDNNNRASTYLENDIINNDINISYELSDYVKTLAKVSDFNGINLNANVTMDTNSKQSLLDLKYSENNKEIIDASFLFESEEYAYLDLKDIYGKILKINMENADYQQSLKDVSKLSNINSDDLKEILSIIKTYIQDSIDYDLINKKSTTVTINNKKYNLKEYFIENNAYDFLKNLCIKIENDEKFISLYKKISDEELKLVKEIEDNQEQLEKETLIISFYSKNMFTLVGGKVNIVTKDDISNNDEISYINIDNNYFMNFINNEDKYVLEGTKENLKFYKNDIEKANISYIQNGNNETLNIEDTKDNYKINLSISDKVIDINMTSNIIEEDTNYI